MKYLQIFHKIVRSYSKKRCVEYEDLYLKVGNNLSLINRTQGKFIPAIYSALLMTFSMPSKHWKPYYHLARAMTDFEEAHFQNQFLPQNYTCQFKYYLRRCLSYMIAYKNMLIAETINVD